MKTHQNFILGTTQIVPALKTYFTTFLLCLGLLSCTAKTSEPAQNNSPKSHAPAAVKELLYDSSIKTIHIFVALCDNKYQGIVPVPPKIGNGQDPANNLYWGCSLGISAYFRNSKEWKLVKKQSPDSTRLERLIFKHISKNYYLVADAYDGRFIKQCTQEFLRSSCGQLKDTLTINNTTIGIAGNAAVIGYIGHDGLMDFKLNEPYTNTDGKKRDVIILACYSKSYFAPHLQQANVNPLVWTTGLMAPEAYTIHDALSARLNNAGNEAIRTRAAQAYARYQKCSEKAARGLLVTGW